MAGDLVFARIVHILAATVWVGGNLFLLFVAVPYARSLGPQQRVEVTSALGRRFRPVAWCALGFLVASGLYTMGRYGLLSRALLESSEYGRTLLVKLVLVAVIITLAALHDFVFGPRARRVAGARTALVVFARTNGVLTVVVPIIGVLLAH